jgi:hypothetical protein
MRRSPRRFASSSRPRLDRVVEPQHAVVDQDQGGGRRDRLGEIVKLL